MSKTVVIAEKPSVGRDIARVLKANQKGNGYLEGDRFIVTWGLGHLVTLADPETYDEKYAKWALEDLPMLPAPLKLVVIPQTRGQFNAVKAQLLRKDVDKIIIATDAGREGELVARWIIEKAKVKKHMERLWISSVTDKAIKEGLNALKPSKKYDLLYESAKARSESDWYVGINATRALTCKHNAQLSCGRVQTPTLAMIQKREEAIETFQPKPYFGLKAMSKGIYLTWYDSKTGQPHVYDEKQIPMDIKGQVGRVLEVKKTMKSVHAPALYDLTEVQREANARYGFSAKETLNVLQRLYETHKVLTYPRTDSRFLSSDIVPTLKDRLKACGNNEFSQIAGRLIRSDIRPHKTFVNDALVTDHHAIIPTEQAGSVRDFSREERLIYDMVVKRFIAVLMPPFEFEATQVTVDVQGECFKARGKVVKSDGWKVLYGDTDSHEDGDPLKEQRLPILSEKDQLKIEGVSITKGHTKPPARFTEGTLLSAMEKSAKYGIGTVATRADIIEKLLNTFVMEKKGNDLYLTSKGRQLLNLVPEALKSADLTADWERKLEQITKGQLTYAAFIKDIVAYARETVSAISQSSVAYKHDNMTREPCPECGKFMLDVNGKKGKMRVCQDRLCGYRKSLEVVTNARCPNCHKKMVLRGEGDQKTFSCKCGHREKLSAFNARRKEATNKGSAQDLKRFLSEQNKAIEVESPFAKALSKLNIKE